jgi:formiminoglutamase
MSGASSSAAGWSTLLDPAVPPELPQRSDDPRLGQCVRFWSAGSPVLRENQPVLVGFPQDEGVRRNLGRPGAAEAPNAIRHFFYRLTPWDATTGVDLAGLDLLDIGNIRITGTLEQSQEALAEVVGAILAAKAVPIVLGGGHETAYGHYLGYVRAGLPVGIINLDAHLDVRPSEPNRGHSGSPFRQAMEHPSQPLPGDRYTCLGAQPHAVSRQHFDYVQQRGGTVKWAGDVRDRLCSEFQEQRERLGRGGCPLYVTLDSDVVQSANVPGVSAPNPLGLSGREVIACARLAGKLGVASFDVVEINPPLDRDGQSTRWAALAVWNFLTGLASRQTSFRGP